MNNTTEGVHTTAAPKGSGWVNKAKGVVLSSHRTKAAAIARGRRVAKRHGEQFTEHRRDGSVIATRSYEVTPI